MIEAAIAVVVAFILGILSGVIGVIATMICVADYLSAIKYKNDPGSLAIIAFENAIKVIKAIKGAIEPVGCRDFCTAIYCKMITSKKKKIQGGLADERL